jgi:hypothetical protein
MAYFCNKKRHSYRITLSEMEWKMKVSFGENIYGNRTVLQNRGTIIVYELKANKALSKWIQPYFENL